MFKDKTLLITGGTGSFGTVVLEKFLQSEIKEIRVFSRDEKKQDDLRRKYNCDRLKFYLGDVRSTSSVAEAMVNVDYVFHAAALKQVPSCEFFPMEAVKTNVVGTENVLNAALTNNVERVIVLSTDKAVYPINAMGISKAMMEKVMIAKSRNIGTKKTVFSGTRYGNVMASRGSVIPLLIEQIKTGKPLTITDPRMTRFMMSLDDALDLVLFAFSSGMQGDIFVQKAPAASLELLAYALKDLYNASNELKIIGTRHGEKLYETLVSREEMAKAEDLGDYFRLVADTRGLNYDKFYSKGDVDVSVLDDYHSHNTTQLGLDELKSMLLKLDIIKNDIGNKSEILEPQKYRNGEISGANCL